MMKITVMKAILFLLLLALPLTLVSCGGNDDGEETETTQLVYETEDEEGWSPIWRP